MSVENGRFPLDETRGVVFEKASLLAEKTSPELLPDLVQAGWLAALRAWERFNPSLGIAFPAFARLVVEGGMLDYLRGLDPLSRRGRELKKRSSKTYRVLAQKNGEEPTVAQIAERLGIRPGELVWLMTVSLPPLSLDRVQEKGIEEGDVFFLWEAIEDPSSPSPEKEFLKKELLKELVQAVKRLPARKREMVLLYYVAELTMKQIGERYGISESRVSQILSEVQKKLKSDLSRGDGKNTTT